VATDTLVTDLLRLYNMIVGKKYKDLTLAQRRILYAVESWKDGADIDVFVPELIRSVKEDSLPDVFIKEQLEVTFEYTDEREILAV
jgi:hypothetical protein